MKKTLNIISILIILTMFFSIYQMKIYAMDEVKNYISKKETAEMIGRAILMELFPYTVYSETELEVIDQEDTWQVMNILKKIEPQYHSGFFWLVNGGIVGVVFRKSDCQIVELIVLD